MIWKVINSIDEQVQGASECDLFVYCDGIRSTREPDAMRGTSPWSMSKIGTVTEEAAEAYRKYKRKLQTELREQRGQAESLVVELSQHNGFAFCVKQALLDCEAANVPFCLLIQHDRCFAKVVPETSLHYLMDHFFALSEPNARYVGFPTVKSSKYDASMSVKHKERWESFRDIEKQVVPNTEQELIPLCFWYDSNHLAHVKRYLEIYTPFLSASKELKHLLDTPLRLSKMVLRKGDFIEDRFGQVQRDVMNDLLSMEKDQQVLVCSISRWFGCYLLKQKLDLDLGKALLGIREQDLVFVRHLRGRTTPSPQLRKDIEKEEER